MHLWWSWKISRDDVIVIISILHPSYFWSTIRSSCSSRESLWSRSARSLSSTKLCGISSSYQDEVILSNRKSQDVTYPILYFDELRRLVWINNTTERVDHCVVPTNLDFRRSSVLNQVIFIFFFLHQSVSISIWKCILIHWYTNVCGT